MKLTGKRIFSAVMLVGAAITVYQVMGKPQPVAAPLNARAAQANAQAFDQKLAQLSAPRSAGSAPAEVHFTSDEVSAEMAQSVGAIPAAPANTATPVSSAAASPDAVPAQLKSGAIKSSSKEILHAASSLPSLPAKPFTSRLRDIWDRRTAM
jgi:hypothetical protein